jgi:hypothetical protein
MLSNGFRNSKKLTNNLKKIYSPPKINFSWFGKIKRHFDSLLEPTGKDKPSSLVDSNLLAFMKMREFQGYLSKNSYDMAVLEDYSVIHHSNFGTIDNPNIVFSADTSWRMIICAGPGSEEESSAHEKMYMVVRAGPIHRCQMCGQCFKLLKLKDSFNDEQNMFYSNIFTDMHPNGVGEPEDYSFMSIFNQPEERDHQNANIMPIERTYLYVNADEADHIMVDPAYRMEKYKNFENDIHQYTMVMDELSRQDKILKLSDRDKLLLPRDIYERWTEVEQAILKFDRIFNRYEKFEGRAGFDPENHERRERRMLERKSQREKDNYTYYFGGLNETEQMFRDYYESDLEEYPESDHIHDLKDERMLRASDDFNLKNIQLTEPNTVHNEIEAIQDIIEKSLFKYRYRRIADPKFDHRNARVVSRFLERAKNRDPQVFDKLDEKLEMLNINNRYSLNWADQIKSVARQGQATLTKEQQNYQDLMPYARYIAEEGLQQFKDYYETDDEEGRNSEKNELWTDLNEKDKLRFAECYSNDFTKSLEYDKYYVTIPKRPYDNKKSIVHNFMEDLVDFNNRVRPIATHLAFKDAASKFKSLPMNQIEHNEDIKVEERYRKILGFSKTSTNLLDEINKIK